MADGDQVSVIHTDALEGLDDLLDCLVEAAAHTGLFQILAALALCQQGDQAGCQPWLQRGSDGRRGADSRSPGE